MEETGFNGPMCSIDPKEEIWLRVYHAGDESHTLVRTFSCFFHLNKAINDSD
jgi:hypothetical protein